jgi:hypothetical protein
VIRFFIAALAASSLVLAACGDGGGDDAKPDAVEFFIALGASGGLKVDQSCVETAVDTLSDADAQILADQDPADPDVEAFNEAIDVVGDRVFDECVVGEV